MSKVCENMVLNRLRWSAQPVNMFSFGFGNKVGTQKKPLPQLYHTSQKEIIIIKKHSATLIMVDIEKAFEMVSSVVLHALANAGIGKKMLSWIHDFLNGRTGAVQFQIEYSSSMTFKNGTPQGGCLSPILFSYVMNRLLNLKQPHQWNSTMT